MSKINNVRLPNAPSAQYSPQQFDQLVRSIEQIVLQLNSNYTPSVTENTAAAFSFMEGAGLSNSSNMGSMNVPYGSFFDTTTQTAAAINTAYAMTLNNTAISNGVYRDSTNTSRMYVDMAGVYNLQFSAQLDKSNASADHVYIWIRVNGTNVSQSAGKVSLNGSDAETIAAWNYFIDMDPGDYVELMWSASTTSMAITAFGAVSPVPAVPSLIATMAFVSSRGVS
jgi:hypothetical protein